MIDEMTMVRAACPEVEPLDDGERAAVLDQVRAFRGAPVAVPGGGASIARRAGESRRHARRPLVAAAAAVAATVVAVVVVVGSGTFSGSDVPPRDVAAADQLRVIADHLDASSAPAFPYSIRSRHFTTEPDGGDVELTDYRVDERTTITKRPDCDPQGMVCESGADGRTTDPRIAGAHSLDETRAAVEARVDAMVRPRTPPGTPGPMPATDPLGARFWVIASSLESDRVPGSVKADLLRMLSELGPLVSEPGVANSFGLVGTRFDLRGDDGGGMWIVVDPVDGYVLESGTHMVLRTGVFDAVSSYDRPVPGAALSPAVQDLVAEVAARSPQLEAAGPPGTCSIGYAGPGDTSGIDVPPSLSFSYCR